jgi:putative transposase
MNDFNPKFEKSLPSNFFEKSITEIAQAGAELMLKITLEAEISDFISRNSDKLTSEGLQCIVRNGYHQERLIKTGVGEIEVKVPRSRVREQGKVGGGKGDLQVFESQIVPRYLRRTQDINELIPLLYLKGISSGDFSGVLSQIIGKKTTLSPNTVLRLKDEWSTEHKSWSTSDLSGKEYVYWWVDGIYFNTRLEEEKTCVLVIIGATPEGIKELVAIESGYRENEISWKEILLSLKASGLEIGPKLAIGDGALGFWKALTQIFPATRQQRCWIHRLRNVVNKLPKTLQEQAKRNIKAIYLAPTRKEAEKAFDKFIKIYEAKYPQAVECLLKTKEETLAFFDFPAEHWRHIRSTNPIESTFATVRLRTYKTKGCCSRESVLAMVFKIVQTAQKKWHRIHGYNLIPMVLEGIQYVDGVRMDGVENAA